MVQDKRSRDSILLTSKTPKYWHFRSNRQSNGKPLYVNDWSHSELYITCKGKKGFKTETLIYVETPIHRRRDALYLYPRSYIPISKYNPIEDPYILFQNIIPSAIKRYRNMIGDNNYLLLLWFWFPWRMEAWQNYNISFIWKQCVAS